MTDHCILIQLIYVSMDRATLYYIVGVLCLLCLADAVANDPAVEYKRLGSCKVSI